MKNIYTPKSALIKLFLLLILSAQAEAQVIQLPDEWKFKMGDNSDWANAAFDDSLWATKKVGSSWAATGEKENVFAWYRTKIIIPSDMRKAIENGNGIKLNLGKIDDVDQTFFNGKCIGQSGSPPPNYQTKWDEERHYIVSPDEIRYDKENVISVRVFSPDIGGIGMYQGPYTCNVLQWADYVSASQTIKRTTGNAFITTLSFTNKRNIPFNGTMEYFVRDRFNHELHKVKKEIHIQPDSSKGHLFTFAVYQPGKVKFVKVGYRFTEKETQNVIENEQFYLADKQIEIKSAREPNPIVKNKISDVFTSLSFQEQHLKGYLENRYLQNFEQRLINVDEKGIINAYLQRPGSHPWIGEHIGKYLEAASNAWKYTHDSRLKKHIDRMMYSLINSQLEDGYLGTYVPSEYWTSWDVWSHKYNLYGLLGYYSATAYQPALDACKKIGDLMCNTFGSKPGQRDIILAGTHAGMAATSILDPMVELYKFTGEKKYLDFCYYLVDAYEQKNGPKIISSLLETGKVNKVANGKTYEMLSNLVGLVNLYQVTGDDKFLQPAVIAWNDVVNKRLYLTGTTSSWEHFQNDDVLPGGEDDHVGEGCVTVTWIQLNHKLLTVTGELKYAEQIEKTFYNHLLGAENPVDGCISDYTPLMGKKPFIRNISCCQSSVPRGIAMLPYFTFGNINSVPTLLLYEPASYNETISASGKKINISLEVKGRFPESGDVTIILNASQSDSFSIALRVPTWCTSFIANVGGETFHGIPGQTFTMTRRWKMKNKIQISFAMPVQIIPGGKSYPGQIAFQRGPQILAFDNSLNTALQKEIQVNSKQKFFVEDPTGENNSALLPKLWKGNHAYSVNLVGKKRDAKEEVMVLVPFADASQMGSEIKVWLPLEVQKK